MNTIPDNGNRDPRTDAVYDLIDALATIQRVTTTQVLVPDLETLTRTQWRSVLDAGRLLRGETIHTTWSQVATVHLHPGVSVNPEERFAIRTYERLTVELPGQDIDVGLRQVDLPIARIDPDATRDHDDHHDVRFIPAGSNVAIVRYYTEDEDS